MEEKSLPLVSVVVPCYNHEKYVKETIESIINQTYKNIELIVIDDGSKDNSSKILEGLSKKYGFYYEHQKNMGLSATLNKLIMMAQGKYIALIASDDICTLNKVEILVNAMEELNNDYVLVCGNAQFIDDKGELFLQNNHYDFMNYYTLDRKDFDITNDFGTYVSILKNNYIPVLSTLIKRNALIEVGLYEESICLEDWNMWLKLSKKYKMKYIDQIVGYYRWHDSNATKTMNIRLSMDTITLLEREKEYCKKNNLILLWREKYYTMALFLLRNKFYKEFIKKGNS